MKRHGFIGGAVAGIAVGAAGAHLATRTNAKNFLSGLDKSAASIFKSRFDDMMSGSLGYVTPDTI